MAIQTNYGPTGSYYCSNYKTMHTTKIMHGKMSNDNCTLQLCTIKDYHCGPHYFMERCEILGGFLTNVSDFMKIIWNTICIFLQKASLICINSMHITINNVSANHFTTDWQY